jgi:uncharacterized protein (DUF4213/DUF364 family)
MDYKSLMGYGKKKNPTKKQSKPKVNQVLESIKEEFNIKEVGAAAQYRPHIKKIDKYYDLYWKSVQDFGKVLEKKGMKKESKFMHQKYYKHVVEFKAWFTTFIKELL